MFKQTLLATATAGLIAAGAMVGTSGTASAEGIYVGGPGWSVGIGDGPHWRPGRDCRPVFRTERWFDRWGAPAVFFSRMLPIVRTFISLPAGVARMPFWRFTTLTLLGCIPWVFMLAFVGKQAADRWTVKAIFELPVQRLFGR